jgi:hypothetical protein
MPALRTLAALAALTAAVSSCAPASALASARPDPLAAEVARWTAFLDARPADAAPWKDVRRVTGPELARVRDELAADRRLLALLLFAPVHERLVAAAYVEDRSPGPRTDMAAFEAEWKRVGDALRDPAPSGDALGSVRPAALRALAEAARHQVRIYYDASVDYGRNTDPESGLHYLGAAQAARDYVALVRTLSAPSPLPAPPLRSIAPELEALEDVILAAYRPPLSIDRHRDFIAASAAVKEARELDAAGLRHGALLRYLQAVQRFALLRGPTEESAGALDGRLRALESRLAGGGGDHSLGRLFLEGARSALARGETGLAATAAGEVLPRYLAALEPAPRREARAEPRVTVTLVRWPYT